MSAKEHRSERAIRARAEVKAWCESVRVRYNEKKRSAMSSVGMARKTWSDVPELYRKHIARLAGLPITVAGKREREIDEVEKIALRNAVVQLREQLDALMNI